MLPVSGHVVVVTIHALAATIWVGGQLTLAALVPALRRAAPEASHAAARRFGTVAWLAYAVLVATGISTMSSEWADASPQFRTTLMVKIGVVAASGVAAFVHGRAPTPRGLAVSGALSALTAVLALFLGVVLGTSQTD